MQYETLGKYIQAFEFMVEELRLGIRFAMGLDLVNAQNLAILLHHQSMTAQPLFDIHRAIINNVINHGDMKFEKDDITTMEAVLKDVAILAKEAVMHRNDLIHGTWYIGWNFNTHTDGSVELPLEISKRKVSSSGLKQANLPKIVTELFQLMLNCYTIRNMLFGISLALHAMQDKRNGQGAVSADWLPQNIFVKISDRWSSKISYGWP